MVLFAPQKGEAQIGDLLDKEASEWRVDQWMNSEPLSLEASKGKVVLIRWFTSPSCPYCSASAPALNKLWKSYRDDGLSVIGFYHHKSAAPLDVKKVEAYSKQYGFAFPVAIDHEWKTLKDWWLTRNDEARFTSVSFLLDKEGIIRHIHPGGSYELGSADYDDLERAVKELLSQ